VWVRCPSGPAADLLLHHIGPTSDSQHALAHLFDFTYLVSCTLAYALVCVESPPLHLDAFKQTLGRLSVASRGAGWQQATSLPGRAHPRTMEGGECTHACAVRRRASWD
jgi:hypothetical protein